MAGRGGADLAGDCDGTVGPSGGGRWGSGYVGVGGGWGGVVGGGGGCSLGVGR